MIFNKLKNSVINSITVLFKEPALIIGLFFILSSISLKLTLYTVILIPVAGGAIAYIAKHLKIKAAFSQTALGNINNIDTRTINVGDDENISDVTFLFASNRTLGSVDLWVFEDNEIRQKLKIILGKFHQNRHLEVNQISSYTVYVLALMQSMD